MNEGISVLERYWRYGGPRDFWISRRFVIERLIKENKLEAISPEHFAYDDPVPLGTALVRQPNPAELGKIRWPIPFPGGMRIPHIHFEDRVFELDKEQWAKFSNDVITDFTTRLKAAGTVDFRQLGMLAESMPAV